MDEMTWTDPQLKARYERNLKAMEQRRAAHPELLNCVLASWRPLCERCFSAV